MQLKTKDHIQHQNDEHRQRELGNFPLITRPRTQLKEREKEEKITKKCIRLTPKTTIMKHHFIERNN